MLKRILSILIPFLICSLATATSQQKNFNEGIVRITVLNGTHKNAHEIDHGYGVIISKDGEFITSRSLVQEAVRFPNLYTLKVTNKDGSPLSKLKLAKCGLQPEMDVCLMKVDYSSMYWFKFHPERPDGQKIFSLKNSKVLEHLTVTYTSSKMNNFVENILLRVPYDNAVPRGAPLFDEKGMLHGMSITYGRDKVAKDMLYGLPNSELELFILMNRIFYPLMRSRDANYFLSDLEKMLREKKTYPGGTTGDIRKLRLMEKRVQVMWPSYKAEVNAQGMQELKDYYDMVTKIGEATFFHDEYSYSKKENIQRLMDKRKHLQAEVARAKQEAAELEMKISAKKGEKSPSILEHKINELEELKNFLAAQNGKNKEKLIERKRELKKAKDERTKDLIRQGIEQTKENIEENKKKIGKCSGKLSKYKRTYSLVSKSKSDDELMYESKLRQVQILKNKVKGLNDKAREFFEDAI
jgi:hypothetical protein